MLSETFVLGHWDLPIQAMLHEICLYSGENEGFTWAEFPHQLTLEGRCITGYVKSSNFCEAMVTEIGSRLYVQRLITPSSSRGVVFTFFGWVVTDQSLVYTCEMPRREAGVLSLDNLDNSVHHVRHTTSVQKRSIKCSLQNSDWQGESCHSKFCCQTKQ